MENSLFLLEFSYSNPCKFDHIKTKLITSELFLFCVPKDSKPYSFVPNLRVWQSCMEIKN